MIQNLPSEVIVTISRFLQLKDKISLNATCHRINNLISKTTLYEDLDLLGFKKRTEGILRIFENKQLDGTKVRILRIDTYSLYPSQLSRLPTIFPFITKVVNGIGFKGVNFNNYLSLYQKAITTWINTLEQYYISTDWYPILKVLEAHTFPKLTELELGHVSRLGYTIDGFNGLFFLHFIKNVPSLTKLILETCDINFELLEKVHKGCPKLETLRLQNVVVVIGDEDLPQTIVPANSLLELKMTKKTIILDRNSLFLDYILMKYPYLQSLSMDIEGDQSKARIEIQQNYFPLGSYDGPVLSIHSQELRKWDNNFSSTTFTFGTDEHRFLKNLPTTLKRLKLVVTAFDNTIDILAQSNSNISTLKLTGLDITSSYPLEEAKQRKYLPQLTSLKELETSISLSSPLKNYSPDILSASVTKLTVLVDNLSLPMESILSMFPSLETLDLTFSIYYFVTGRKENSALPSWKIYPNLRVLIIRSRLSHHGLFECIKSATPNLREFSWIVCHAYDMKKLHYDVDVTGWKLKKFHLSLPPASSGNQFIFNCKVKIQEITKEFFIRKLKNNSNLFRNQTPSNNPGRHQYYRSLDIKLNIICDDIEDFVIDKFSIFKFGNRILDD